MGVNNKDVKFHSAEISILPKTSRRSRVHHARWDSGQGESERTNASVGEAIADGGALKWEYHQPCEGMSKDDIENLSLEEYEKKEEECTELNAWCVAQEVNNRVFMEPGPAGDLMFSHVTPTKDH